MYYSIAEFIEDAEQKGKSLSDLMIEQEMAQNQVSFDEVWNAMDNNLKTMEEAVKNSISDEGAFSPTGLTGGDALKLKKIP